MFLIFLNTSFGFLCAPPTGSAIISSIILNFFKSDYDPKQDVSVIAYLTFVDLTTEKNFIVEMKEGLYQSAWRAREALGYPGRPQVDEK